MRAWTAVPFTWIHIVGVLPVCANKDVQRGEVNEAGVVTMEEFAPESDDDGSAPTTAHSHLDLQMQETGVGYGYTWKTSGKDKTVEIDPVSAPLASGFFHLKWDWIGAELEKLKFPKDPTDTGFFAPYLDPDIFSMVKVKRCSDPEISTDAVLLVQKTSLMETKFSDPHIWLINKRGIIAQYDWNHVD